jgi:tRNA(Ile)-lysidine synthase
VSTPNVPSEAELRRFHADLTSLIGPIAPDQKLGIALSGGPDSLALLLLCQAAFPGQTLAATVDHGLRAESADEALQCAAICADIGVAHTILTPATPITGSLQAAARAARYQLLGEWANAKAISHILTGHHSDDQAETVLMRLNRGSGLAGLAGIRAVNGRIVRPVLGWRRDELADLAAQSGLTAIADPSNQNDRFDRARIRKAMASADWLDAAAMAKSAAALADAEQALDWITHSLSETRLSADTGRCTLSEPHNLPKEISRRLVLVALKTLDPTIAPSGPELMRFIALLQAGSKVSIGSLVGESRRDLWLFTKAPARSPRQPTHSP